MSAIFGETLTFTQENGPDVQIYTVGDEYYARYEDAAGYTTVYDEPVGRFCYAIPVDGKFVSSGVPISDAPPSGLKRHIREREDVRQQIYEARRLSSLPPPTLYSPSDNIRTFGPNAGLLAGRRLSTGVVRGLTVLVEFQDVASTVTRADVSEMLNGNGYTANGNFCSAREYFRRMSSSLLDYSNVVVGPYRLSRNRQYYATNLLVEEALRLVVADGIDLKQFDSRNEGIIDALNFMYAGQTQYIGELWPHNSYLNWSHNNMRSYLYLLTSMGRHPGDLSIGTFCHENGHLLCRFPDMYDYGNRDGDGVESAGIGAYCLMGSGNHLNRGRTPSPVCGYLRELAGWCTNVVNIGPEDSDEFEAVHGAYDTIFKFGTDKLNEYFIIENRAQRDLDTHLPSGGLAVYHCDTKGSNEWQEGSATRHYQCSLLQADGHLDLEHNINQGDGTDLFVSVQTIALSNTTTPSSRQWDGADSGLILSKIGNSSATVKFSVGREVNDEAGMQVVRAEADIAVKIPDKDKDGVTSTIQIAQPGRTQQVKVIVDVTHPVRRDLQIRLIAPSGQEAILQSFIDGDPGMLAISYDSMLPSPLTPLIGQPMAGDWTLQVSDLVGKDSGILNKWSLELTSGN